MIKIEIKKECVNQDTHTDLNPGEVVEVSEFEAGRLCAGKFAVPVIDDIRECHAPKYEKRKRRYVRKK